MKKMIEAKQTLKWPKYRVNFYSGYYRVRQQDANDDGAVCFVAHHFNAVASAKPEYVLCNVGSNASSKSIAWARDYAKLVGQAFGYPLFNNDGICIGGMGGRGDSQLRYTRMPAILPEPLFCSNPEHAAILRSDHGRQALAEILVDSIRMHFPAGGLVAFSIGHLGNPAAPGDRGALVYAQPDEPILWEADVAADVLKRAQRLLEHP